MRQILGFTPPVAWAIVTAAITADAWSGTAALLVFVAATVCWAASWGYLLRSARYPREAMREQLRLRTGMRQLRDTDLALYLRKPNGTKPPVPLWPATARRRGR